MTAYSILCTLPHACAPAAVACRHAQDVQERVIKFGHLNNADHPVSFGVKRFAELLAAKSGGKLKVQEFPASHARQRAAAAVGAARRRAGDVGAGDDVAGRHRQGVRPGRLPVRGRATSRRPTRCSTARSARRCSPSCRRRAWSRWATGTWAFATSPTASGRSRKPEDLDGLKLRVIPNPVFLDTFKAFKANPVPMPFAELYGALEAKAVDGQENPFAVILSNKFYEVQKYVSATNHVYAANIILVSKRFWDRLSPAEQKMMTDAANEARAYQRQVSRAAAQKAVGELQAKGMQYNELERRRAGAHAPDRQAGDRPPRRQATTRRSSSSTTTSWRASASERKPDRPEPHENPRPARAEPQPVRPPRAAHLRHDHAGRDQRQAGCASPRELGVELETLQSNHEGVLIDKLHECIDTVGRRAAQSRRPDAARRAAARRHQGHAVPGAGDPHVQHRGARAMARALDHLAGGEGHDPGPGLAFLHGGAAGADQLGRRTRARGRGRFPRGYLADLVR